MRARSVKPGFFKDVELSEVSVENRYLFLGLWCMADREGKLKDDPKQIKFEIFPETKLKQDINTMIGELAVRKFILRYIVNGEKYILVKNFSKHQSPHKTEKRSVIPDPSVDSREPTLFNVNIPLVTGLLVTGLLDPPYPPKGDEIDFEKWWKEFPSRRKHNKPGALQKWKALKKAGGLPPVDKMLAILRLQKQSLDWTKEGGEYIPGPVPYLNKGRYIDESLEITNKEHPKHHNPKCLNCKGTGLRPAETMPDGSPAFKPCGCEE